MSGAMLVLAAGAGLCQQKLAQTGLKFLSVSTDARASAMGEAAVTSMGASSAMFFNPAGMARLQNSVEVSLGRVQWIADINYSFGSAALNLADGRYGVFGVNFLSVDYGDILGTVRAENDAGFEDTGVFSPTAFAVGVGYAKALSDKFSVGGDVRYVRQDLQSSTIAYNQNGSPMRTDNRVDVFAFDFGVLYRTGFKSLDFGMCLRNFSEEIEYVEESFQLPLTFELGVSVNAMDLLAPEKSPHDFILSIDAVHPRDFNEQLNFGGEYVFMDKFALRAGYKFPSDEHHFSAGAGFRKNALFALDYAYTPFGLFNEVHRFSVRFGL
jgi:long-subunit fatty acid transport protein